MKTEINGVGNGVGLELENQGTPEARNHRIKMSIFHPVRK